MEQSQSAQIPLTMPKMSMTMEEGTLVEWQVAEGDVIAKGDVVAVVMTDKVDMEVESPAAGTVAALLLAEGDVAAVGTPIAMVASEEEDLLGDLFVGGGDNAAGSASGPDAETEEPVVDGEDAQPAPEPASESPSVATDGPVPPAVPLARKLARDHGLDLREITATGPHGTVRVKDVKQAIARSGAERRDPAPASGGPAPAPATGVAAPVVEAREEELLGTSRERRTRQLTARAMEPTTAVPQFAAFRRLDLSVAARARGGALRGISWTTLMVRAYALLLRAEERLNGSWAGSGVKRNDSVDVVLAVDTPGGLMVPVLREADQQGIRELDAAVREIARSAKEGKLDPSLLGPGTGTVSNLGGMGVDRFTSLVTPPQATALSIGAVGFAPVVEDDGAITARMSCEVGLSLDHRVADGADAARGLQALQDAFDDPLRLAL